MQVPRDDSELDELVYATQRKSGPEAAAEVLRELLDEDQIPGGSSRAAMLVALGEQLESAGDLAGALSSTRLAVEDGGPVPPDARCYLHNVLLHAGEVDEAAVLADQLMKERSHDPFLYEFVGEGYELADDVAAATRWFTAGMLRCMRHDEVGAAGVMALMQARRRVREAQGFDEDNYDLLVGKSLAELATESPQR